MPENKATLVGVPVFVLVAGVLNLLLKQDLWVSIAVASICSVLIGLIIYRRGD